MVGDNRLKEAISGNSSKLSKIGCVVSGIEQAETSFADTILFNLNTKIESVSKKQKN